VERYRQRISGPLLDRIDLHVEVPTVEYRDLSSAQPAEASTDIRARVEAARAIQRERSGSSNARLKPRQLKHFCQLDESGAEMLKIAMNEWNLSARAYDRILKVARTIADLDNGQESILPEHLGEAIQYRALDRAMFS
jgi:magnesium chelatase family protein